MVGYRNMEPLDEHKREQVAEAGASNLRGDGQVD